ncbi:MAG TPA: glycoside hydrolase family 38 C-terminal domain-containing protein [Streptosporangiales bacterium]
MVERRRLLHMIGNAHIDAVWLWQWPEGYQEVRATFWSAIQRMDEYPEFVFTCDSVAYLTWVEDTDPELFEAIRKRIADGRWQVVGGWWVEPDCNIPSGESFVRQALHGQRYLLERFGVAATVGCNLDPFGHNAQLPQLLRKAGMDSYVFLRPGPHEQSLPGPYFWWEAPDGSRVLAYRIAHEYGSSAQDVGYQVDKSLAQLPADEPELMVFYGVGNHGGGPTRANLDSIRRLDALDGLPSLRCSSPRAYFDRLLDRGGDFPVHAAELQHHAVGCYSAHSGVKRWNRRAENILQRAEKWGVVATVVGELDYPSDAMAEAWELVLFNQFHDTLAGTAIPSAYEDSRDQYGHAASVGMFTFNRAIQSLSRRVRIPYESDTSPVVVFNPHPWPVRTEVELEFGGGFPRQRAELVDDQGRPVAVQEGRSHVVAAGRRRLVFAAELPALGYRLYRIRAASEPAPVRHAVDAHRLENDHLAVEVDPDTGAITVHDKRIGADLVAGGTHAEVLADTSDTWGHRVRRYDRAIGSFRPRRLRMVEDGPVRSVLRVESGYGSSTLVEEFVLGRDAGHVDVRVVVDWHEQMKMLKLRFPTTLADARATFEIPYGHVERATNGGEEPAQAWVDVTGRLGDGSVAGFTVANDGKYGHDVRGGDIGVTSVRSPAYAWHEPKPLDDDVHDYLDQGRQEFTLRLIPHAGDWRDAGVVRRAAELNQPAFPLLESYHDGDLPPDASFAEVDAEAVVPTVLKPAADGSGDIVLRAYEAHGRPAHATVTLRLLDRAVEADFGPAEVKTFRIPRDAARPVVETDLLEREIRE